MIIIDKSISIEAYTIFILVSVLIGVIYNYFMLRKANCSRKDIVCFLILFAFGILFFGKVFEMILSQNLSTRGFSGYGGAFGALLSVLTYYKITKNENFAIIPFLSLPLMYSISKLGCFFRGCCLGIPYEGIFSVYYATGYVVPLFSVQLLDAITFMGIFAVFHTLREKNKYKNLSEYMILASVFSKFLLDFLRLSHDGIILSMNQVISLIAFFSCIIYLKLKGEKER